MKEVRVYRRKERVSYMGREVAVSISPEGLKGKRCSACREFKEYTEFTTHKVDGLWYLVPKCNSCKSRHLKGIRKRNPEKNLMWSVKSRANRRGIEYNLTEEDFIIPSHCPVFDIPLSLEGGKRTDNTPTMDRIDTEKGYVKGNVSIISWRANRLKNDATLTEIERLWLYVKDHWNETH